MTGLADEFGVYDASVPRDVAANVRFRRRIRERAADDQRFRDTLWDASCRDPLFWINAFVWTYNPRKSPSSLPFVTWPFQDEALRSIFGVFGRQDAGIEKSRDVGASWLCLLPIAHHFIFGDQADYLALSYKADLVDNPGDMSALMPKLDFVFSRLPEWMQPPVRRVMLRIYHLQTGSVIRGETTTGNAGRGGRFKVVFLDEFAAVDAGDQESILAATADTTECRLFNSTPNGTGNAYYDLIHRETTRKIRIHWSEHPEKRRGLYKGTSEADFQLLDDTLHEWEDRSDPGNPVMRRFPEDYPFNLDGRLRSVWYDGECVRRANNEREIAKELDIDYASSDYSFFPVKMLAQHARQYGADTVSRGTLEIDAETAEPVRWTEGEGFGKLWCVLDGEGKPPPARYVCAADIALGTGATPSTISVANERTGEKVAAFSSGGYSPERWAALFVAVCKWFAGADGKPAKAIWEANGPGRVFGKRVMEHGGVWVYYRKDEMRSGKKPSDFPGWWNNDESATVLFNEYREALNTGRFINRDREAIEEARAYVVVVGGGSKPVHSGSQRRSDPTGARDNHGDMVVADALAAKLCCEAPRSVQHSKFDPPRFSMAWRFAQAEKEEQTGILHDPAWAPGGW